MTATAEFLTLKITVPQSTQQRLDEFAAFMAIFLSKNRKLAAENFEKVLESP